MANALIVIVLGCLLFVSTIFGGYLPRPNSLLANQSGQNVVTASQTPSYMAPTGANLTFQTDEFTADIRYGRAVTVRNLYCNTSTAQAGSTSIVIKVRNNHADTSVTCTITGGASSCTDLTNVATISANSALTYSVVGATLTGTPTLRCGLEVIAQ